MNLRYRIQGIYWPALAAMVISIGWSLPAAAQIEFDDVTAKAGLIEPLSGIMGHGGALGDVNGDGLLDIYIGGFCDRPNSEYSPATGPVPAKLLFNQGDGTFKLVEDTPAAVYGRTSGAVFADLDNNGTLELYAANNARASTRHTEEPQKSAQVLHAKLYRNDDGKLVDISEASGACPEKLLSTRNIGVFDYDRDGLLDLLVVEDRFIKNPRTVLFHNEGNLKFKDVNAEVGLPDDVFGLGLAVADLNRDGRPDFFVPHSNRLFLSTKDGKYTEPEELKELFAWKPVKPRDNEDWPCGAAFGDLNRDGELDLVVSIHHDQARNRIFLNGGLKNGVPQFRNVSAEAGLPAELTTKAPHCEIQDFDNDGWPDLYLSAAWLDDDGNVTPLIYHHTGKLKNGVPIYEGPKSPAGKMVYYPAGPSGDLDRDGRIDLFLINWYRGNHSRLLRNVSEAGNWLEVQVVGKKMNRMGIGAQVHVYPAGKLGKKDSLLGYQEVTTGYGYASGQEAICHFGLGKLDKVDLLVTLPSGMTIEQKDVTANQRLQINEP